MLRRNDIVRSISPESLSHVYKNNIVQDEFYELLANEVHSFQPKAESHVLELKNYFNERILPLFDKAVLREACKPSGRKCERKLVAAYGLYRTRRSIVQELASKIAYEHEGKPLESYFEIESTAFAGCRYLEDTVREAGLKILKNIIIADCLIGQISQICGLFFFGFEALAKLFVLSFCLKLATRVIQGQVIQHNDIWKTLKMLSGRKIPTDCQICKLRDECNFHYPFGNFANLYAFIIKIRMLADYTEVLHGDTQFFDFISTEYPKLMFPLCVSLNAQIRKIHEGFLWSPLRLEDSFKHVDDILAEY